MLSNILSLIVSEKSKIKATSKYLLTLFIKFSMKGFFLIKNNIFIFSNKFCLFICKYKYFGEHNILIKIFLML